MFALHDPRFRDILLLILGFFGLLWFFIDLENQHPLSTFDVKLSNEQVLARADSIFHSYNYEPVQLKKRAFIESKHTLIDKIQSFYGREKYLSNNDTDNYDVLPLHTWQVEESNVGKGASEIAVSLELTNSGEVLGFKVSNSVLSVQTPFSRQYIRDVFGNRDGYTKQKEDSIISRLVDFQHIRSNDASLYDLYFDDNDGFENDIVWRGVKMALNTSYWKRFEFNRDSLVLDDDGVVRYVKLFMSSKDTLMGVVPKLEMELLPAGVIRSISYSLDTDIPSTDETSRTRVNTLLGFFLVFFIWVLISFYLRIKARAVDTRPALIVAIIAGFLVTFSMVLQLLKNTALSFEQEQFSAIFQQLFSYGIFGAITAVAFFVATAVSDSVTRQYWPNQLKTWDLVRRGMFKNQPVGWAIIRAICIGSIAVGLFTLLLALLPKAYISGETVFLADQYILAPLANIIISVLLGLGLVVITFMIVGNQVYSKTSKKWLIPVVSAIIFGLIDPIQIEIHPELQAMIINAVIGFLFGLFYIQFDFVSVALGMMVFINFMTTINGWLVGNSPDTPVFVSFVILQVLMLAIAFYFLLTGDDTDSLPEYIPEYIEDQAKEQRVQQELDIARNVQLTFLPDKTPKIPGYDTAAICIPAQETGGDYYDIIRLDDTKSAIAIGDVSGKGIQAAFYMTFAKGVIHSLCSIFPSPKTMMFRVNLLFTQNATRGTFISMIYGVLNSQENTFTFVRCGHNPILLKRANGTIEWLQPRGVALGMAKGEQFNKVCDEHELKLQKGDVLVLYTDGITEAQNAQNEFYEEQRLKNLIKRAKSKTSKELRDLIIEDVRTFIGETRQFDDMTLVVIKA